MKKLCSLSRRTVTLLTVCALAFFAGSCVSNQDIAKHLYNAGTYSASTSGFGGKVTVTVITDKDKITKVIAEGADETSGIGSKAINQLPPLILKAQGINIDGISGASVSSKAVLTAAAEAIAKAKGNGDQAVRVSMQPGTYTASAYGFNPVGKMSVAVTVDRETIKKIEVTNRGADDEPMVRSVIERLIPRMIEAQSLTIDSITGATASSNAVKSAASAAVSEALSAGGSDPSAISLFDRKLKAVGGTKTLNVDVLVVGMGGSGCAAAMSAAEAQVKADMPVSVLAIDKAGKFGGTSAFCGEPMAVNPVQFKKDFNDGKDFVDGDALYAAWIKYTEGDAKAEIVKKFLDNSGDTIDWLFYKHGFIFNRPLTGFSKEDVYRCKYQYVNNSNIEPDRDYGIPKESILPEHQMVDGYFRKLIEDYERLGGKYMLETEAYELLFDKSTDKVTGVKAVDVNGTQYTINAKAVILATGGFAGNGKMEEKYLSSKYYPLNGAWEMIGMRQNDGKMIEAAFNAGAGSYNIGMCPMVHFVTSNIVLHDYPVNTYDNGKIDLWYGWKAIWSLNDVPNSLVLSSTVPWVDVRGNRFVKEGQLFSWWIAGPTYFSIWSQRLIDDVAKTGFAAPVWTYAQGQGGVPAKMPIPKIYAILDKLVANGSILKADTIPELANKMGVPVDNLAKTLKTYEGFCATGVDKDFGKETAKLMPLGSGPYYALKGYSACFSTCAALNIDDNFNVLKANGTTPIRGLYAVGNDSGGVLYTDKKPYVTYGGAALGWAFTSGRLAGGIAVKGIQGN